MKVADLLCAGLAVWALTRTAVYYDGPLGILTRMRSIRLTSRAFECPFCLSWWVGIAVAILYLIGWQAVYYPAALVGVAFLLLDYEAQHAGDAEHKE